jgi:hypothetical protein
MGIIEISENGRGSLRAHIYWVFRNNLIKCLEGRGTYSNSNENPICFH